MAEHTDALLEGNVDKLISGPIDYVGWAIVIIVVAFSIWQWIDKKCD